MTNVLYSIYLVGLVMSDQIAHMSITKQMSINGNVMLEAWNKHAKLRLITYVRLKLSRCVKQTFKILDVSM